MSFRLSAALACLLATTPAFAQGDNGGDDTSLDDIPHITILGTAHAEVAPDLATISLGVDLEKPTAAEAADAVATKAAAVVAAAKDMGVAPADIRTQSLTLTQTYDDVHDAGGRYTGRKPRGFEASNVVQIRIRNLQRAGTIAQMLIDKGANRFDGINFTVEHPEPILVQLDAEAVKNAKALAQAAAAAAGVHLGRVLQIERPAAEGVRPVFAAGMRMAAAPPTAMPIEAGTSGADASLEVTWAIDAN